MEFAPAAGPIDEAHLLPLWQLEPGQDYEIFLTTAMGMVRYRLGDVVRCTGRFERTPIVEFKQKAGQVVSLGLVQIAESEIVQAMASAGFAPAGRWFFAPNRQGDGLVFYCDGEPPALAAVHAALRGLNQYYDAYVEKTLVQPIAVERLPPGHPAWPQSRHAQTKPRVLVQMPPERS
jgi:hypothetical protein